MRKKNNTYTAMLERNGALDATADDLRRRLTAMKLSQLSVAKQAGIDPGNLNKYVKGVWLPSEKMFNRICAAIAEVKSGL